MHYIRYEGPWHDVAIDRHNVVSTHRVDTDDLTVAHFQECGDDCWYDARDHSVLRSGEVIITKGEFESERDAINVYNAALPIPPGPIEIPTRDDVLATDLEEATSMASLKAALLRWHRER